MTELEDWLRGEYGVKVDYTVLGSQAEKRVGE